MPGSGRARWGWYRLDDGTARELVELSGVGPGSLTLDLGAGDGAITRHLVSTGARVIAFETHADRATVLRSQFHPTAVKVVRADVGDLRLPTRPFQVVANPPFGITSAIIRRLTSRHSQLIRADLVVPVAVAERWAALLMRDESRWSLTIDHRLPRSAFTPRPRIDCCVATIRSRPTLSRRGAR